MGLTIRYATTEAGDPRRMRREEIAALAGDLRRRLFGQAIRPVDIGALIAKTGRIDVNGQSMRLSWGIDAAVKDERGEPALGVCEHDPDVPDTVMISLNGPLLAEQAEVLRSTAVHEFAHAIFDMPAALGSATRRAFRSSPAPAVAVPGSPIDWPEWRADEFMGAFLVPVDRLGKSVTRFAGALRLPFGWRNDRNGAPRPVLDVAPDHEGLGPMIDALSEEFGVTCAFIETRLRKGGFVGKRLGAQGDE